MAKNYALEARIKEACTAGGVLATALDDFVVDHEAYKFTEGELPAYIEKCRTEKPHRFAIQSDHDAELCHSAFIGKNKTAESRLYRAVGPQRFEELKTLYANGAPGVTVTPSAPGEKPKPNSKSTNPWSAESWSPLKQTSIVKGLGVAKAAELARHAEPPSFIGAPRPGATNLTSFRRAG